MRTIQEIVEAVARLSPEDLVAFRAWFTEFDAELWDRQFDGDVKDGRLDRFAKEALQDLGTEL